MNLVVFSTTFTKMITYSRFFVDLLKLFLKSNTTTALYQFPAKKRRWRGGNAAGTTGTIFCSRIYKINPRATQVQTPAHVVQDLNTEPLAV